MQLKEVNDVKFKEYMIQLEPEDEQMLLEIGRKNIIKDDTQCINYGIQKLIYWYMNDEIDPELAINNELMSKFGIVTSSKRKD